jgi:hypothetical protein
MADDDATPSIPSVTPVQQEELEETPLDLDVYQRLHEEEPPKRVVRTELLVRYGIVDCLLTHML